MARRLSRPLTEEEKEKLNKVKAELCWQLRRSMARTNHYSSQLVAYKLGSNRACVSKVQCGRVNDLTFNQLFRYLVRLEPNFKFLVST